MWLFMVNKGKIYIRDPLTATQMRSGVFFLFMMTVRLNQADQKRNNSRTTFRECVQHPLDVDGIDASIDTKFLKKPQIVIVHLAALENCRNPYIGTFKKEGGDIFSE